MNYNVVDFLLPMINQFDRRTIKNTVMLDIIKKNIQNNYLHEIHFQTDKPKLIELGDALEANPYHLYFYMIARFYFFDQGDNQIIYYYGVKEKQNYFATAALAALPSRFQRETVKRDTHEYIEMPGCNWYQDSINEPWMYSYVRDLYKHIWSDTHQEKNKYIYISRSRSDHRSIVNEEELYKPLKEIGFSIYHLEDLTFEDQIKLFCSAKIITGGHGAGLSHCIYCEPNTVLCEINHEKTPAKNHYYDIAKKCGLIYYRFKNAELLDEMTEHAKLDITAYINALVHIKRITV